MEDPITKSSLKDPRSVDLDAVAALQVFDVPVAPIARQLAMMGRNVRETQHDITAFAPAYQQVFLQKRNRVASSQGNEFAVHVCPS